MIHIEDTNLSTSEITPPVCRALYSGSCTGDTGLLSVHCEHEPRTAAAGRCQETHSGFQREGRPMPGRQWSHE